MSLWGSAPEHQPTPTGASWRVQGGVHSSQRWALLVFRACSALTYRLGKDVELWGESLRATLLIWV